MAADGRRWVASGCGDHWHVRPVPVHRPREPDPVAVERLCSGDRPARVTRGELAAAAARLTRWGLSAAQVAARLHCTQRSAQRYRAAATRLDPGEDM
jgi:hypothetical protein